MSGPERAYRTNNRKPNKQKIETSHIRTWGSLPKQYCAAGGVTLKIHINDKKKQKLNKVMRQRSHKREVTQQKPKTKEKKTKATKLVYFLKLVMITSIGKAHAPKTGSCKPVPSALPPHSLELWTVLQDWNLGRLCPLPCPLTAQDRMGGGEGGAVITGSMDTL